MPNIFTEWMGQLGCSFSGNNTGKNSYSRWQAEKLLWENVLQPCTKAKLARDVTSPHAFLCCLEVLPAWPALLLISERSFLPRFSQECPQTTNSTLFSYAGAFSPLKSLSCHNCSFPLELCFKKRHGKMMSGDNTDSAVQWGHKHGDNFAFSFF